MAVKTVEASRFVFIITYLVGSYWARWTFLICVAAGWCNGDRLGLGVRPWFGDGALADPLRPPEPGSEQRRDRRRHEGSNDQRVEQQAKADSGAHLTDHPE